LPAGVVTALKFDLGGSNLAINVEDSVTPPNVYVLDVTTQALTRWTRAEAGPVDVAQLSVAAPMRFRSWDHSEGLPRQLTGLILRPAKTPAPTPVLIWLPGDERQPRPRFDAQLQSIVNTGGYTVIMPGLRGSGGRGRGFAALAEGDRREHAVRDVGALLAWIAAQPGIDGSRIAIAGVGTSADIAQMSAVRFNERIHAAVLIDGMPGRIQPNALSGPLLIVRGFDNPPLASPLADQLLWRMRTAGVDSWLLSARDGTELWPGADRGAELARVITQFLAQSLTQSQARSRTPALN
jgi:pimeloyl-ACP methyl ester carboxylesterase